jgi:hypothetical protein
VIDRNGASSTYDRIDIRMPRMDQTVILGDDATKEETGAGLLKCNTMTHSYTRTQLSCPNP